MSYDIVGKSIPRKDGIEKVTGKAMYGADYNLPGQLYGAVCRSPYAHARIKSIHTEKARSLPGVKAVVTGQDHKALYGQFFIDQPILAFDKVRYQGEPVAAVAAEDEFTAMEAVRLIEVEYEELPVVDSIETALEAKILVHDTWDDYVTHGAAAKNGTNICDVFTLRKGDVEEGFKDADLVVENEFRCSMLQHTVIETHAALASADRSTGEIVVYTPAQSPFVIRAVLAQAFDTPLEKVRVVCSHIGGGFGSKLEARVEPLAVMLSMHAKGRPVKIVFSRHEEFMATVTRAPVIFKMKTGVKQDGTLTSHKMEIYWDTGAYATTGPKILWNCGFATCGPYKFPHAWVDSICVVTNKSLGSAYRGFGVTEIANAIEYQMDRIAGRLDMDPLEFRLKNVLRDGDLSVSGEPMRNTAVKECLEAAAKSMEWESTPHRWVNEEGKLCGKGLACFIKMTGTPTATSVIMKLNENGTVTILDSSREMGQGLTTAFCQIAAETLGIDVDKVSMAPVDTMFSPFDKTTTSSRSTFHGGNAVVDAAEDVKRQLLSLASKHYSVPLEELVYENGYILDKNNESIKVHINDIAKSNIVGDRPPVVGYGTYSSFDVWDPPKPVTRQSKRPTVMWMFGADAAEVEIDPKTGEIKLKKIAAAHDVGTAINPRNCRQQIEGSVIMGLGNTLMEEMIYENGNLRNPNMVDYKVPTFMDADVEIDAILLEKPYPEGPFGAKGVGEPALCAVSASIVNAVNNACGKNFNSIPIKPEHILFSEEE